VGVLCTSLKYSTAEPLSNPIPTVHCKVYTSKQARMIIIILPIGLMVRGIILLCKACKNCCSKREESEERRLEEGIDQSPKATLYNSYGAT